MYNRHRISKLILIFINHLHRLKLLKFNDLKDFALLCLFIHIYNSNIWSDNNPLLPLILTKLFSSMRSTSHLLMSRKRLTIFICMAVNFLIIIAFESDIWTSLASLSRDRAFELIITASAPVIIRSVVVSGRSPSWMFNFCNKIKNIFNRY